MDFGSRDGYRQAVEELAEPTGDGQVRVALKSVERARQIAERTPGEREAHIGYYLIGGGRRQFERGVGWKPRVAVRLKRAFFRHAATGLRWRFGLWTAALVAAAVTHARALGSQCTALVVVVLLTLVPASELAIQIVQRLIARLVPPRRLPRLDLVRVPETARTMVIIPTILDSVERARELADHVEVQALGNLDPNIHFAILSDFRDADAERLPHDDEVLAAAADAIRTLNAQHGDGGPDRFFLFHRTRQRHLHERGRVALRTAVFGPHGRGPVHDGRVRHLPGPVRRGHLHREGVVRRRRLHRLARGCGAGKRAAVARPVRRSACARRPRLRRRARGRVPVHGACPRPAPAPVDSRRLADPAVAVPVRPDSQRDEAEFLPAHLAMEDSRQPAPQPRCADAARAPRRGVDDSAGGALVLDGAGAGGEGLSTPATGRPDARPGPQSASTRGGPGGTPGGHRPLPRAGHS